MDGSPVDMKGHGVSLVLPYCAKAIPVCTLECTVTFETVHSPMYYINGSCFSAGGSGEGLQQIGVTATHDYPNHVVKYLCHTISKYTCYMNETVYTEVEVRPGKSFSTRWHAWCAIQDVLSLGKHRWLFQLYYCKNVHENEFYCCIRKMLLFYNVKST